MKPILVSVLILVFFCASKILPQICVETRVLSENPAVGIYGNGTCWIAPNGKLVTAAHVAVPGGYTTVKFNMYEDGQEADSEDVYVIIQTSIVKGIHDQS